MTSEAKIYLSSQRGCTQSDWFRSYHTFSFNGYDHPDKMPFGDIIAVNDDTLKAGCTLTFAITEPVEILLLPVVGSVEYVSESGLFDKLDAGESNLISLQQGDVLRITNPFDEALINFLHVWRRKHPATLPDTIKCDFDPDDKKNQLIPIASSGSRNAIGKFGGRMEGNFKLNPGVNAILIFILEGAFEVQNRLLETRDALALWNIDEVEMEALSNDAIVLLFEVEYPADGGEEGR